MNNADFLSDAVALDLGKSGVKVAETLEIQVGEEWWRLINAADVSTVRAYQGRALPTPTVVDGVLYLDSLSRSTMPIESTWELPFAHKQKIHTITYNDTQYYYSLSSVLKMSYGTLGRARLVVWTNAAVLANSSFNTSAESLANYGCVFWDNANNRIIAGYDTRMLVYTVGVGMSSPVYVDSTLISSDFWCTDVFPENPEYIYSFFSSQAGGVKVKKTLSVAGTTATTLYLSVGANTGSVVVTAASGFAATKGIFPFYLRSEESVGVAWINATTGQIEYALESDGWAVVRYFPALPGLSNENMYGLGTTFIPGEGEFFLMNTHAYSSGNVTREAGYSFPANWTILGAYRIGADCLRLFGRVGTTLYGYDLTLSTMSFAYLGTADTTWTHADLECTKVGESGALDLLVFGTGIYATTAVHEVLVLYNRVTNSIVWKWSEFEDSAIFPETYMTSHPYYNISYCKNGSFFRFDDSLLIMRGTHYPSAKIETIVASMSEIMSCADAASVSALFVSRGAIAGTIEGVPTSSYTYVGAGGSSNHCLTGLMHDDSFFYFIKNEGMSAASPYKRLYRMSKSLRSSCTHLARVASGRNGAAGRSFCSGMQNLEGDFLYDNRIRDLASADNLFHISASMVYSSIYPWGIRFWDPVNSPTAFKMLPGIYSAAYPDYQYATTLIVPAIGNKGETVSYKTYGTTVIAQGGSWDLTTKTGFGLDIFTAPFSPVISIIDERDDVAIYFGAITSGELPYMKHSALQGRLKSLYAVRVADSTVYELDLGHVCGGGMNSFNAYGSSIIYNSVAGMMYMINTGANPTDGMGGGTGGGSAATSYIYDYLDRQFVPYPFAREGIRAELSNISKTTKITLPETQDNLIRGMLAAGTDFRGSRCILRRVFPDHMDEEGSDIVLLDGYIQDWSYVPGKKGIAFSVSKTLIDVGAQFPKRLMNMGCSHVFKGSRCRYLGEEGRCLKTRAFCTSLGNLNQFGGFPWVAARQRRVMWK